MQVRQEQHREAHSEARRPAREELQPGGEDRSAAHLARRERHSVPAQQVHPRIEKSMLMCLSIACYVNRALCFAFIPLDSICNVAIYSHKMQTCLCQ